MTAINHTLTGTAIALIVKEPLLAVPLAFLSHFVCDVLPHFGFGDVARRRKYRSLFNAYMGIELLGLAIIFSWLLISGVQFYVFVAIFAAVSPDIVWAYRYFIQEKRGEIAPTSLNVFNKLHSKIQWGETVTFGLIFELIYAAVMLVIIGRLL